MHEVNFPVGKLLPAHATVQNSAAVNFLGKTFYQSCLHHYRKAIEKNFCAKKILVCGIGSDEYNRISACQSAKEIWEALQTAHEGITHVNHSKIDMLTIEYELFKMQDNEFVQEMQTRFTSIINQLHSLGETISRIKLVRKILSVLPSSWERKANAIIKAKDLQELSIDELVGNLKTYEVKKKKDSESKYPKKEKNLVLKTENNESSGEDGDMAYLTRRFKKMDQYKNNSDKASKRNLVLDRRFNRKKTVDNVARQTLAAWGDSSSEFGEGDEPSNNSMMEVESKSTEYDSIFALMSQSNDEDNDDDEVNFLDIQRNLKSYSPKKLISLANMLIDTYHSLVNDSDVLAVELGEAE
ncbi:kinetochore-associated protein DSN1-like [Nicotiana sylvestris]|uniref:kinetochore-associated protein DSN1-like n=1 Tax=Nicotiana sylvestris TaxID=4096 RepID=UPI00388CDB31